MVQERFTPAFQPHHTRELVEVNPLKKQIFNTNGENVENCQSMPFFVIGKVYCNLFMKGWTAHLTILYQQSFC